MTKIGFTSVIVSNIYKVYEQFKNCVCLWSSIDRIVKDTEIVIVIDVVKLVSRAAVEQEFKKGPKKQMKKVGINMRGENKF